MAGIVVKGRFPRRRLVQTVATNLLRHLFQGAARSWARNAGGTAPALGSMTLLLVMSGLVGLTGFALHNLEQVEASQASLLHVYLRDSAADADIAAWGTAVLVATHNVEIVTRLQRRVLTLVDGRLVRDQQAGHIGRMAWLASS